VTTANNGLTEGREDTISSVAREDKLCAAAIRGCSARIIALIALFTTISVNIRVVTRSQVSCIKNNVRESQREIVFNQQTLDRINGINGLDVLHAEGNGILLHGIIKARANELTFIFRLIGAKSIGKHVLHHAVLHVVEPFRLTILGRISWWATKAVRVILVLFAVLDETKTVSLLRELHVLVLLEIALLQTVTPVRSFKNAHGREDIAGSTVSLILGRCTHIVRNEVSARKRHSTAKLFLLFIGKMMVVVVTANNSSSKNNNSH